MPDNKLISYTRERILDAAEQQFMAHGFDGTSMRMITNVAGVNLAAVNYHFGSKEGLLRDVFRRRLTWLNQERLAVLDELERHANNEPLKPSQILEAFFGTLLRIGEEESLGGMTFLRLLGRTLTDPSEFIRTFFAGEYAEVINRYRKALILSVPDVPREEIVWRLHFMLGSVSYAIAGTDTLDVVTGFETGGTIDKEATSSSEAKKLSARLMPFLLGGLRAPLHILSKTTNHQITGNTKTVQSKLQEKKQ
jgi:AcrR family transcriptional regulator